MQILKIACLLIFLWFLRMPVSAQTSGSAPSLPQQLARYTWKKRVLLVLSPAQQNADFRRQQKIVNENSSQMQERDLVFLPISYNQLPTDDLQYVRRAFKADGESFRVVLIGKDGGAKLHSAQPISADELFRTIDAMPMRQQEMRRPQ